MSPSFSVKRARLFHLYQVIYQASLGPTMTSLVMSPPDYVLLADLILSAFDVNHRVDIEDDDSPGVLPRFQQIPLDKNILANMLEVMDEQAIIDEDGEIEVDFYNARQILHILEARLWRSKITIHTTPQFVFSLVERYVSICDKMQYPVSVSKAAIFHQHSRYLKPGDIVRVGDNFGPSHVKIESELQPGVYIVTVVTPEGGYDPNFPYGKRLCAVLIRFPEAKGYRYTEVCLFDYYDDIGRPKFTAIQPGTVSPPNYLEVSKTILRSCTFEEDTRIRLTPECMENPEGAQYGIVQKVLHQTPDLEGSEFIVSLLSYELYRGILRKRPFDNKGTPLYYISCDLYELEISPL